MSLPRFGIIIPIKSKAQMEKGQGHIIMANSFEGSYFKLAFF